MALTFPGINSRELLNYAIHGPNMCHRNDRLKYATTNGGNSIIPSPTSDENGILLHPDDELNRDGNYRSRKVGPPPIKTGVDYVNPQEEEQMELYGYKPNFTKTILTWILIILTVGLLRLLFHWRPHWMIKWTHDKCPLDKAKKVLLVDQYFQIFTEDVIHLTSNALQYQYMKEDNISAQNTGSTFLIRQKSDGIFEPTDSLIYFENKKVRYIWDSELREFIRVRGLDKNVPSSYFFKADGLSEMEQKKRRILYGDNSIVVKIQSVFQILFQEVLEPFYIFQIFSILVWAFDEYIYYASCIVIMSALSLTSSVIQTRRNQRQLRDTIQAIDFVEVCRGNNVYENIESTKLVPGDVIVVPKSDRVMQCDAVLINGTAIVNESMLTGESVPVTKIPLSHNPSINVNYHPKEHAKHTLFCGTKVIQSRFYEIGKVRAVVIRSGYQTSKGELVRSIMYPKPADFKFNRHIAKFIGCMALLASIGFIYTVILKGMRGTPAHKIAIRALDLITIVIPPALPAAMTIGIVFAQSRLRRSKIFCISPRSVNISGCINCVCFDKTGTLTEDDLNFAELIPSNITTKRFEHSVSSPSDMEFGPLQICLAACHELTIVEGKIIGDPLDLKMFEVTKWELEEPDVQDTNKYDLLFPTVVKPTNLRDNNQKEVGIVKKIPFNPSAQRMGVVTRLVPGTVFELYVKGAPEMIVSLCDPSTIPDDFTDTLMMHTEKGYRVIALAYRPLVSMTYVKIQRAAREELEKNLVFLGLLIMKNMLKPETTPIIETLSNADIRTIMVTGDNMLTALSVARECNMIQAHNKVILLEALETKDGERPLLAWKFANTKLNSDGEYAKQSSVFQNAKRLDTTDKLHVAVTGKTFKVLRDSYPELLNKVVVRGTVFARMAPEQKQQLIELLQDLGYYVGMCGDGANDCGALKAAHAGISLSEAEASVASPFTSKTPDISCVPILIREGRASLVTAFGILKYMACYSLTQFVSVIILYTFYSNLTDKEFLYEDLFLITLFVTLFGRTEAFTNLDRKPPPSSLIGITPLSSIGFQVLLVTLFQVLALVIVWQQSFYIPHKPADPDDLQSHDNYAIFAVSVFQYITLVIVFSKGNPYRMPIYTNILFMLSLVGMTALTIYLVVFPSHWIAEFLNLELKGVTYTFKWLMVLMAAAHFVLAIFAESFLVDYLIFKKFNKTSPSKEELYNKIDNETNNTTQWLPTNDESDEDLRKKNLMNNDGYTNVVLNESISGKSPPESGIWVSNASSASPILKYNDVSPPDTLINKATIDSSLNTFTAGVKHNSSSPTTISSLSESCDGSDPNIPSIHL